MKALTALSVLIGSLVSVGFILLVPILVLSAGLLAAWNRWKGRAEAAKQELVPADSWRSGLSRL